MRKYLKNTTRFSDVTVTSNVDLKVELRKEELQTDVWEYIFDLSWDEEQAKAEDSKVIMCWSLPLIDVQYMWHPDSRARRVLDADWRLKISSMLTGSAPLAMLFNGEDQNAFTFATDEVKKVTSVQFGVDDGRNVISGEISMGLQQFVGRNQDTLRVRADFRKIPYYKVLDDVRLWWEQVLDLTPMAVPETARLPMYSSWYNYHQDIQASQLEKDCAEAKKLGMETIIVDDGWQTADGSGGYGYTGDWEVYPGKIPNMAEHVKRVHEAGMKYILWFSVPFVGYYSKNWERFKDKIICRVERNNTGVLDPRYPEVREFLIGIYEKALRDYDLDGLKLDFIDRFKRMPDDAVQPGMDYQCIQEATERLMTDVMLRLKAIKPDIMIEFRQRYIGPGMRRFGNIFRVSDCPSDITTNRVGITDLRLISGGTAVHSDMITWHDGETAEDAALQVLNTIFGVTQFSKVPQNMTPDHREMTAFWLNFARENRKILQESEFIPYEPHYLYPVIMACNEEKEIIGVYAVNKILYPDLNKQSLILNATKQGQVFVSLSEEAEVQAKVLDCRGRLVREEPLHLGKGVAAIEVPRSGLLELTKIVQTEDEHCT